MSSVATHHALRADEPLGPVINVSEPEAQVRGALCRAASPIVDAGPLAVAVRRHPAHYIEGLLQHGLFTVAEDLPPQKCVFGLDAFPTLVDAGLHEPLAFALGADEQPVQLRHQVPEES